jgi:hypothetical protein
MKRPIFVRLLADAERNTVEQGPRPSGAFTPHRSQIVAACTRGEHIPGIVRSLSCNEQTTRAAV